MSDLVLYKIRLLDGVVEEVCRETVKEFKTDENTPIIIPISKNPSEEELRRVEFYKNYIINQGYKNVTIEEVDDETLTSWMINCYD